MNPGVTFELSGRSLPYNVCLGAKRFKKGILGIAVFIIRLKKL